MILLDRAIQSRQSRGRPIRVGVVGADPDAQGLLHRLLVRGRGVDVVALAGATVERGIAGWREAGGGTVRAVHYTRALEAAVVAGDAAVTDDPLLLCRAREIDVIVECGSSVEQGAATVVEAIRYAKPVVLANAELEATLGPILRRLAEREGVPLIGAEAARPDSLPGLWRRVEAAGARPLLCGAIGPRPDPHRLPAAAGRRGPGARGAPDARAATAAEDGTRAAFELAAVANALGLRVLRRGGSGIDVPPGTPVRDAMARYPLAELMAEPGVADYVSGAAPGPGLFVLAAWRGPGRPPALEPYRLGAGPLHCVHAPLSPRRPRLHRTIARAALFGEVEPQPAGGPRVEVVATAKMDLEAGRRLDGAGGYAAYGQVEDAAVAAADGLLPMGLTEGCRLRRGVPRDRVLSYHDVELPPGRLCDRLRAEQAGGPFRMAPAVARL